MLWYGPSIYSDFRCIATACRHNCCVGWEIDIDETTRETYRGVTGNFGERLASCIAEEDGTSSFRLTAGDRCPFLNGQNLCDIHIKLGEGALCQICRDHPRFRNYFSSRGEIGLGLSCEAAASLILNYGEPMVFVPLFDDGVACEENTEWEIRVLHTRDMLYKMAQDRGLPLQYREENICAYMGIKMPSRTWAEWVNVFLSLERMAPTWDELLLPCKEVAEISKPQNETPYEQFLVYLLFRHLADAEDRYDLNARVAFCVLCSRLLRVIVHATPNADIVECARLFSAEIEYSPENTEQLLMVLEEMQTEEC